MKNLTAPFEVKNGQIHIIPILNDNYSYVIEVDSTVIIVDPGESEPLLEYLRQHGLVPEAILVTHGDYDHYDGIPSILSNFDLPVWVPAHSNRQGRVLNASKPLKIGALDFEIIDTPGHRNHDITYYCPSLTVAFCGDALFPGGCGRVNTNRPDWLWQSLLKIKGLPDDTALFGGHEYSLANYAFALSQQEADPHFKKRKAELEVILRQGGYSMPTTVRQEKMSNIFLRCDNPEWRKEMQLSHFNAEECFKEIRQRKNTF